MFKLYGMSFFQEQMGFVNRYDMRCQVDKIIIFKKMIMFLKIYL